MPKSNPDIQRHHHPDQDAMVNALRDYHSEVWDWGAPVRDDSELAPVSSK